jgi:transcriptional regulator with XRE-family HTH domain
MKPLPNYLQSQRKRLSLSQEEVGFLLGIGGMYKGAKVCRDENFAREPSLREALAYEVMYGRPVSELFAGLFQQARQDVTARAKFMQHRKVRKPNPRGRESIIQLADQSSVNQTNK